MQIDLNTGAESHYPIMRRATWIIGLLLVAAVGSGCLDTGPKSRPAPSTSPTLPPHDEGPVTNDTLTADFDFLPVVPVKGQLVQFRDRSSDTDFDITEYAWDFGDGTGSTARSPTHRFATPGPFAVTLRVKNAADQVVPVTHIVQVTNPPTGTDDPTPTPGGNETPPGPEDYPLFGAPKVVQGVNGGEPSLAIDSGGRIFINPIGRLYRSENEGQSFTELDYLNVISGDSHVTVDADDRVWVSDLGGLTVPLYGSILVWTSENHGASFTKGNPAASDTVLNDRQWLAVHEGGVGYLLYRDCTVLVPPASCVTLGSFLTRSLTGGVDWTPTGKVFTWTSYPFVDPNDGTLYIVQSDGTTVRVSVSTDQGVSFTERQVTNSFTETGNIFVSGDVDDAGNVYVAWVDRDSSQYDVWMSYSTNKGATWSKTFRVSAGLGTTVFPWITAGGDGKVAVGWYGTDVVGEPDSVGSGAGWYVYAGVSQNAHDAMPTFATARATDVVHAGNICTSGTGCGGADRDLLDFLSVDLMPDGRVAIAYADDGGTSNARTMFVLQNGGPLSR